MMLRFYIQAYLENIHSTSTSIDDGPTVPATSIPCKSLDINYLLNCSL